MTDDFEVAMARVMTQNGIDLQLVDLAITRAPTRPKRPPEYLLNELRLLAAADRNGR